MAQILIAIIQVHLVPSPSEAGRRQHKLLLLNLCHQPTITAISWPPAWISQPFLYWSFLNRATPFFTAWLFLSRF